MMNITSPREQITQPDGIVHTFDLDDDGSRFCFSAAHPTGWEAFVSNDGQFTLEHPDLSFILDLTLTQFTMIRTLLNGPELDSVLTTALKWFAADPANAPITSPERAIFEREKFDRIMLNAVENEPDEAKRADIRSLHQQVLDVAESLRRHRVS